MKKLLAAALCAATAGLWACGGGDTHNTNPDAGNTTQPDAGQNQNERVEVTEDVTADTTWTAGKDYLLKKHIAVKNGATLTIEKGVKVMGDEGSSLLVTREGKINAVGTRDEPIVFTSSQPVGSRAAGNWGGVVLLGSAKINLPAGENVIEGYNPNDFGDLIKYGGTNDAHDCGTIQYARIEFAGFEIGDGNELNGLTVGACGSDTELDYIQSHMGLDDGVEFFGGTAGIKHLVVTQTDDDSVDWDLGWTGKVQFLIIQQNAAVGDKGFESDNQKTDKDAAPLSQPEIWNATLIGSDKSPGSAAKGTQFAMHLKNGTAARMNNFVVAYFTDGLIDVDGADVAENFDDGKLFIKNSVFWKSGGQTDMWPAEATDNDGNFDEAAKFMDASMSNRFADPQLAGALDLASPNFKPTELITGGATPPQGGFFDPSATFVGAIGAEDWTAGWTAFPAE